MSGRAAQVSEPRASMRRPVTVSPSSAGHRRGAGQDEVPGAAPVEGRVGPRVSSATSPVTCGAAIEVPLAR